MLLPAHKKLIVDQIVSDLQAIVGVTAIVLGGSYAAGSATESSDVDLGIYYWPEHPFDISSIKAIADKYCKDGNPVVTDFYGWGPWVNGGAWIQTAVGKVDFVYRNLQQVVITIEKARKGEWENDYQQQPPHGFSSVYYLSEINCCIPLYDPQNQVTELKNQVKEYPLKLKESVIRHSLWDAEFSLWHAHYFFGNSNDIYNTAGCLTRATKDITTALLSFNEIYPMGDKRSIDLIEKSVHRPRNLRLKIEDILAIQKDDVKKNIERLKELFNETMEIAREFYEPNFDLNKAENA